MQRNDEAVDCCARVNDVTLDKCYQIAFFEYERGRVYMRCKIRSKLAQAYSPLHCRVFVCASIVTAKQPKIRKAANLFIVIICLRSKI